MGKSTRVAVITGASAGIGKAAAKSIAGLGWKVIALGRNLQRSEQALLEIRRHAPYAQVDMLVADLSIMAEAQRAAREVARITDSVDVFLNNAGGIGKERILTREGNETVFASNHLGPFLLTQELLPLMRNAVSKIGPGRVRIINVSSAASDSSKGLDWNDLQSIDNYVAYSAYSNAKLANLVFTRALARRVKDDGISVYAMHPGIVDTNFASYADEEMQRTLRAYEDIKVSAEEGADTLIWLSTISDLPHPTGSYFFRREPIDMNELALDDVGIERFWKASEELVVRSLTR